MLQFSSLSFWMGRCCVYLLYIIPSRISSYLFHVEFNTMVPGKPFNVIYDPPSPVRILVDL